MKNLWTLESKWSFSKSKYSLATFGGAMFAFLTREDAREKIRELKDLDEKLGVDDMRYRAIKYMRDK